MVRIAIVGDYKPEAADHRATDESLRLAGERLGTDVAVEWLPTPDVLARPEALAAFDGVWASAGSPYRSFEGAIAGIRWAREAGKPFVAT